MKTKFDIDEVKEYISNSSEETVVYIGTDSERFRKNGIWFARFCTVVIVHIDGKHGCKLFAKMDSERDFDQKKDKPRLRLMNEVMRAAQMFLDLSEVIGDRECEIHLDLNPSEKHGSNCVVSEAIGYVHAMCQKRARIKPSSFAATTAADHLLAI